jgi:hypothetical protein
VPLAVDPDASGFVCDVPEELPAEFVEPEFGKLEFVEPEFVVVGSDPEFAVAGLEPGFEVAGLGEPAVPGTLPGACRTETRWRSSGTVRPIRVHRRRRRVVPDVDGAGEFDPGMLPGEVAFGDDPFGVAWGRRLRSCARCRRFCRRSRGRRRWCCGLGWWCRGLGRRRGRARRTLGHRPTRTATEYE